ncbi:MAG: leucine-rich repeat domain-containing protein [Spirochaetaceae bacterium]|nr:leucine-rich repeat domain-containing protein [Spirochaetaceae bacterium]
MAFSAFCLGCAGADSTALNQGDLKKRLKITAQPQGAVYSLGTQAVAMFVQVEADADGVLSYQWHCGAENNNTGGSAIEGATEASYTPPTTELGVVYYYVTVTSPPSGGGAATSSAARVEVNNFVNAALPALSINANKTVYLAGESAEPIVAAAPVTDGGQIVITWYKNGENSNTGGVKVGLDKKYTPSTAETGTFYYYFTAVNTIPDNGDGGAKSQTLASAVQETRVDPSIRDVTGLKAALENSGGADAAHPLKLTMVWTDKGGWDALFETLAKAQKYVELNMNATPAGGLSALPADFSYTSGSSDDAKTGKGYVVSFVLPEGIKQISYNDDFNSAFEDFHAIKTAAGAGLKTIGFAAFLQCSSLGTVYFPSAVKIEAAAFVACASLRYVDFPSAVTIENGAFYECTNLVNVDFPLAETIGNGAFYGCTSLVNVYFFPSAKTIGNYAFYGCASLRTVYFPSAETIGDRAFGVCTKLKIVNLPKVRTIGEWIFQNSGNEDLDVTLGQTVPLLGARTFIDCGGRTITVNIPARVGGYGTSGTYYSGPNATECWANGFRGAGWEAKDGGGFGFVSGGSINTNITVNLQTYN